MKLRPVLEDVLRLAGDVLTASRALVVYGRRWRSFGFQEGEEDRLLGAAYPPPPMDVPEAVEGDPRFTQTYDPDWSWLAGLVHDCLEQGRSVYWRRAHHLPGQYIGSLTLGPLRTMVLIPFRQEARIVGFLYLDRVLKDGVYEPEDLESLENATQALQRALSEQEPGLPALRSTDLARLTTG